MITFIISLITLILSVVSLFFTSFAFIQDLNTTNYVFKNAFELTFSKKKQKETIEQTTEFLNLIFKSTALEIVQSKDKTLEIDLSISNEEAKEFKQKVNEIIKNKNTAFVSKKAVYSMSKKYKDFNFFNLVANSTRNFSNDKAISLNKEYIRYKKGEISLADYAKTFLNIKDNTSQQQIQRKLRNFNLSFKNLKNKAKTKQSILQHFSNDDLLPSAQNLAQNNKAKLLAMYNGSMNFAL
ncbi:hypothetical protein LMB83_08635 [Limosilactobacillus reuteri]|uniref:hypothetical protein n=1 Tax=Limosilactobacillus reuteri TaxID=1598 RepID=UPI001E42C8C5|nr:hypothetical protein [Limosilactobacillus reuteri]MCC4412100.1 hypothetical protein [Limosilactobacillus reuteri]